MKTKVAPVVFIVLAIILACITQASQNSLPMSLNAGIQEEYKLRKKPPTRTPLPPLPGLRKSLSKGAGGMPGGCEMEEKYSQIPDGINAMVDFSRDAQLCIFLQKVDPTVPIRIKLSQPGGINLWSNNLVLDSHIKQMDWQGVAGKEIIPMEGNVHEWGEDGSVKFEVRFQWPVTLPPGKWRVTVSRAGAPSVSSDFQVTLGPNTSYINALGTRFVGETLARQPSTTGSLNFVGVNYPPRALVYLLLYRESDETWDLVTAQQVVSNARGYIEGRIFGSFEGGSYLLHGVTADRAAFFNPATPEVEASDPGEGKGWASDEFMIQPISRPEDG